MWEEELEKVEVIEDMEQLEKGHKPKRAGWKEVCMLALTGVSVVMLATVGITSYRTQKKLVMVREELEEAVSVNMETYLTENVPSYVVGTIEQEREEVTFSKEQTMEMAETVRETLAEDITREVLAGRDELDAEKIRHLEEKLTVSVREKLEQMELITKEGMPVKGEDYFTEEELESISKGAADQVKKELAGALQKITENSQGLSNMWIRQDQLRSELSTLSDWTEDEKSGNKARFETAEGRLLELEDVKSGERLDALERLEAEQRLAALEKLEAEQRLDALEKLGTEERLKALEQSNAEKRLAALEEDKSATEDRIGRLEDTHVGSRLAAIEGMLGAGESVSGTPETGISSQIDKLQKSYEELTRSFQDGCEQIVAACTARQITPDSNSPQDIANAIRSLPQVRPAVSKKQDGTFGVASADGSGPWKSYPFVEGQQYLMLQCHLANSSATTDSVCYLTVTGTKEGQTRELYRKEGTRRAKGLCILADGSDIIDIFGYRDVEINVWSEGNNSCNGKYTILY